MRCSLDYFLIHSLNFMRCDHTNNVTLGINANLSQIHNNFLFLVFFLARKHTLLKVDLLFAVSRTWVLRNGQGGVLQAILIKN
jgi:hypothetical protein